MKNTKQKNNFVGSHRHISRFGFDTIFKKEYSRGKFRDEQGRTPLRGYSCANEKYSDRLPKADLFAVVHTVCNRILLQNSYLSKADLFYFFQIVNPANAAADKLLFVIKNENNKPVFEIEPDAHIVLKHKTNNPLETLLKDLIYAYSKGSKIYTEKKSFRVKTYPVTTDQALSKEMKFDSINDLYTYVEQLKDTSIPSGQIINFLRLHSAKFENIQ
jgi:hypothetical protein